ncbi:uncharacterized protein LOC112404619 isoform X3 [Neophocaena asiaeorientalis asiaeorientalis]|uniref:Uncharacterized protein LOC112404619 isoform X3 n=1 Tax=Neophocaena asiaeorientalis asiaeorientalis TaxID=1706337 RepID=A0A341C1P5_NEOAA|nr:uncharacterized protein LOC112404619 isoform X3 [Neophocaena asiaeorientalis asiaeorientalis]
MWVCSTGFVWGWSEAQSLRPLRGPTESEPGFQPGPRATSVPGDLRSALPFSSGCGAALGWPHPLQSPCQPLTSDPTASRTSLLEQTCKKEFSIVDQSVTPEYRPYRKEHRSTESHGNPQSRVFARVGLSPECPLRAEKHSPAEPPARRAVGSDRCDRCRRPGGLVLEAQGQTASVWSQRRLQIALS